MFECLTGEVECGNIAEFGFPHVRVFAKSLDQISDRRIVFDLQRLFLRLTEYSIGRFVLDGIAKSKLHTAQAAAKFNMSLQQTTLGIIR